MNTPVFPPLFSGQNAQGKDPFVQACAVAKAGCDSGAVVYDLAHDCLRAAIVFAPEVSLREAAIMLPLGGLGFQNALGALAPPEVGVQLGWDGGIYVNGGLCGALQLASAQVDPDVIPDWIVVGLYLMLWPATQETGLTPDRTALYAEGCADVDAVTLLEAWVRHSLVALNMWTDEGTGKLHRDWMGLAFGLNEHLEILGHSGTFIGLDENMGLLLKSDDKTDLIPLTQLLKRP